MQGTIDIVGRIRPGFLKRVIQITCITTTWRTYLKNKMLDLHIEKKKYVKAGLGHLLKHQQITLCTLIILT